MSDPMNSHAAALARRVAALEAEVAALRSVARAAQEAAPCLADFEDYLLMALPEANALRAALAALPADVRARLEARDGEAL